jgi:hypothetical protein
VDELNGLVVLSSSIRVYVPSTIGVDIPGENAVYVEQTANLLSSLFGGATSYKAHGYWKSQVVGLVCEEVSIVESYTSSADLSAKLGEVVQFARTLKERLQQEAIALSVNGSLYLV